MINNFEHNLLEETLIKYKESLHKYGELLNKHESMIIKYQNSQLIISELFKIINFVFNLYKNAKLETPDNIKRNYAVEAFIVSMEKINNLMKNS